MTPETLAPGANLFDQSEFSSLREVNYGFTYEQTRKLIFVFGRKVANQFYRENRLAVGSVDTKMFDTSALRNIAYSELDSPEMSDKFTTLVKGVVVPGYKKIDAIRYTVAEAYDKLDQEAVLWQFYMLYCFEENYGGDGYLKATVVSRFSALTFSAWQERLLDRMAKSKRIGLNELLSELGYAKIPHVQSGDVGLGAMIRQEVAAEIRDESKRRRNWFGR